MVAVSQNAREESVLRRRELWNIGSAVDKSSKVRYES